MLLIYYYFIIVMWILCPYYAIDCVYRFVNWYIFKNLFDNFLVMADRQQRGWI